MMPDCTLADALAATERARQRVEQAVLRMPDGTQMRITLSAGVAMADRLEGLSLLQLLQRADDAMYRAKQAGRNRVRADRITASD